MYKDSLGAMIAERDVEKARADRAEAELAKTKTGKLSTGAFRGWWLITLPSICFAAFFVSELFIYAILNATTRYVPSVGGYLLQAVLAAIMSLLVFLFMKLNKREKIVLVASCALFKPAVYFLIYLFFVR